MVSFYYTVLDWNKMSCFVFHLFLLQTSTLPWSFLQHLHLSQFALSFPCLTLLSFTSLLLSLNIYKTKIMASGPITSWQIDGEQWKQWQTLFIYFFGGGELQNHCRWRLQPWNKKTKTKKQKQKQTNKKKRLHLGRKIMTNLDSWLKSRDITLPAKVRLVKLRFSSSCIWMWELD